MQETRPFSLLLILLSFFLWGITPIYFKWMSHVSAVEIVIHRIIWSAVVLWVLVEVAGLRSVFIQVCKDKALRNRLLLTSILITLNWLTFVYAVLSNQTLEASLGYYINPLVNIALGGVFLQERLTRMQWLAVLLASVGVLAEIWTVGKLSWIACVLALSFAVYGLARKKLDIHPTVALAAETSWMFPFALVGLLYGVLMGQFVFLDNVTAFTLPLMAAGVVTVAPLLLYVSGLPGVTLTIAGFAQYIAPSMVFILAITWFDETMSSQRLYTFGLIWLALVLVTLEGIYKSRKSFVGREK
jgi:chloramphenicol-sensitive protein RarD